MTFADVLTATAAWTLTACGCWAALICAATLLEAVTGGRLRATVWVGCPPALRRALLALVGAALVATPGHASASPGGAVPGSRRTAVDAALPVPARPLGAATTGPRIVVRPGDTLWHLASARLPASATAADVVALVDRLHTDNREVIGADPDLIRPGQRLVLNPPRHREEKR
jgi:hypothetical protein